jgi:4'-phosphopantetheinyl transferase
MIDIYSFNISSCLESKIIDLLILLVSKERREKIKKFKFQQDSLRCLFGDLLSRYAICKRSGLKNCQLRFDVNAYNKPSLIDPSNLYFNVSHSGSWVVCAVADELVGIDIEYIKAVDFNIAKRFFTSEEYCSLMKQDKDNQAKYFYLLWTLKESYVKADGRGLSLPLNSFSINLKNDEISVITSNELNSCFFKKYDIDDFHISAICSLSNSFSNTIKEVTVNDLLQKLDLIER